MLVRMYTPTPHDEIEGIVCYVEQQLEAIRAAAIGLTEEQARLRPCRSALSIGGLIKHTTYGMRSVIERLSRDGQPRSTIGEADFAAYLASFALTDAEPAPHAVATSWSTRSRSWSAMRATPTSSASRSTASPSRRSC